MCAWAWSVILVARIHGGASWYTATNQSAALATCLAVLKALFIFAFYLSVPLWCVMVIYPAMRPSQRDVGSQILLFVAGWLAFLFTAVSAPGLVEHLIGTE
jgi:hypothetical protein